MKSNKISVNCEEWLDMEDKSDQFNEICFKVIEELLKMQKFNEAEELADYCELSKDRIHLARIGNQIEILRLNNDFEEILAFWKSAHIQLMKIGIKDSDFIDFLKVDLFKIFKTLRFKSQTIAPHTYIDIYTFSFKIVVQI